MKLLRELLDAASSPNASDDKYQPQMEGVDCIAASDRDYVPLPKPGKLKKKGKRSTQPSTDKAENSLINNIWFYNNSDAV